jgi:hypothetical protein
LVQDVSPRKLLPDVMTLVLAVSQQPCWASVLQS